MSFKFMAAVTICSNFGAQYMSQEVPTIIKNISIGNKPVSPLASQKADF